MTLQQLFANPVVQALVAPFVAAFFVAVLGRAVRLTGIAAAAGFALTAWLMVGHALAPLDLLRRVALATLAAGAVGLLFDFISPHPARTRWLVALAAGAVLAWVLWPSITARPALVAWTLGIGLAAYTAIIVGAMDLLHARPIHAAAAGTTLGIGSGLLALVGNIQGLGRFGMAMGAASLAVLLVQMLTGRPWNIGRAFSLPVALLAALLGGGAAAAGNLPWYALATMIAVPLLGGTALGERMPVWVRGLFLVAATGLFAAAGVFIAWREVGSGALANW